MPDGGYLVGHYGFAELSFQPDHARDCKYRCTRI